MRELLGLQMAGTSYEGRYVIADIHWPSGLPVERRVWFDPPSNPGSTIIMHQQPNDIWRIDYQLDPADDAEAETQQDRIRDRIDRHLSWLGLDVPWTLQWHGLYRANAVALPDFVAGRVVFAGDAAHLVPIFGVRGLNSGLEDAETLAWTLAAVIRGGARENLLAAYSAERHDAWAQNVANAGKSTLIMSPGSPGHRATRDAVLALSAAHPQFSHLINPRQSSATHAHASPLTWPVDAEATGVLPGDPVEDRDVRVLAGPVDGPPRGTATLNRVRGAGFALVGVGMDAAGLAAMRAAADGVTAARGGEAARVLAIDPVADGADGQVTVVADDGITAALGARAGEVFVVRPDGLLLCRVRDLASLAGLGRRLAAGMAPAADLTASRQVGDSKPAAVPAGEAHREEVWLALSRALDDADPADREGLLTRLAFLLADQVDTAAAMAGISAAAQAGSPPTS
jgi:3-(3-hydroxy-phenyl)propionate hydroxylase